LVVVAVLGVATSICGEGAIEEREGLREAPLVAPKIGFQSQKHRPISQGIAGGFFSGLPPGIGHGEGLVRAWQLAPDPASVAKMAPRIGAELVNPS
jgi:hypothetical protein